jgi:hypothetical protein
MTTYDSTPIIGYSYGLIISDESPVKCVETFDDDRHDNVNLYFEIDGKFYNVHPCTADGRYPVRWIDSSAPVGWPKGE